MFMFGAARWFAVSPTYHSGGMREDGPVADPGWAGGVEAGRPQCLRPYPGERSREPGP